jgi:L-threonylcarbamoyladenylate synthase
MDKINQAIKILKSGGIVVYPTDTAYGLAVDATNLQAVKKLYQLKGRDFHKPTHVIIPDTPWLIKIVKLNKNALQLMNKFWPGPLTIILPLTTKGKSWEKLSSGNKTLGVRYPNNPVAIELVSAFKKPITGTSANLSGQPNCYSVAEVKRQFAQKSIYFNIYYLDGGKLKKTKPSTVVSLVDPTPGPSPDEGRGVLIRRKSFDYAKILRPGPISETQINKVLRG